LGRRVVVLTQLKPAVARFHLSLQLKQQKDRQLLYAKFMKVLMKSIGTTVLDPKKKKPLGVQQKLI